MTPVAERPLLETESLVEASPTFSPSGSVPGPLGKAILWSLAPESLRHRRVWPRLPMLLIVVVQSAISLRLHNTAYRDEALYIYEGHQIIANLLHGTPLPDDPYAYFSGSPDVYPVLAASVDHIGGLTLVRLMSLAFMLVATFSVRSVCRSIAGQTSGTVGALIFGLAGPVSVLGNFATFDAPALAFTALASAFAAKRLPRTTSLVVLQIAGAGVCLAAAFSFKYAAGLFFPVVVLLPLAVNPFRLWRKTLLMSAGVLATLSAVLVPLGLTVGRKELDGLTSTTTSRHVLEPTPRWQLVHLTFDFVGAWIILGAVGAIILCRRRQALLGILLIVGAIAPPAYQILISERVSLHKHVAFGLIFAVPLIAVVISSYKSSWGRILPFVAVWGALVLGASQSLSLFEFGWPNTSPLTASLGRALQSDPTLRTLGDVIDPMRFKFEDTTTPSQFDSTEHISYQGLTGMSAYQQGLSDHYWGYVYLDGENTTSTKLQPLMSEYGYVLSDTIRLKGGDHIVYSIWTLP